MKKKLLFFNVTFLLSLVICGQCPTGNGAGNIFLSQAEIDNFAITYPNCTSIKNLTLSGPVSNLNGLSQLTTIVGHLDISSAEFVNEVNEAINYPLVDISGLNNIVNIGGAIILRNIPNLNGTNIFPALTNMGSLFIAEKTPSSLSGFNNVTSMDAGGLVILQTNQLVNFSGLSKITEIPSININLNSMLTNIAGFNNLTNVTGDFNFQTNSNLLDLSAFESLNNVSGNLLIDGCTSLTNLIGLNNLKIIGGYLVISNNNSLETLNGLNNLSSINSSLTITNNPKLLEIKDLIKLSSTTLMDISNNISLTSLVGLDNINPSINGLFIRNSPQLSTCNVMSVCSYLSNGGNPTISGNANGCENLNQVVTACNNLSVSQNDLENKIEIFPNPTNAILNIKSRDNKILNKIVISDLTGKIIFTNNQNTNKINVQSLSKGLYFLELFSGDLKLVHKFIKE